MKTQNTKILTVSLLLIIISSMTGCKKEKEQLSLNTTEITLKPDQTFKLVISPDSSGCVFTSGNDNIAEVYASGLIIARLVGVTNIEVTNTDKGFLARCKVTVAPEYTMYREPYLSFGSTKSLIKSYETRQIVDENDSTILYAGENSSIDSLRYSFKNSLYTSCICVIPSNQLNLLEKYLAERYVYIGPIDNGLIARTTTDGNKYVVTQFYSSSEIYVYYFPNTTSQNGKGLIFNSGLSKSIDGIKNKAKGFYLTK